VCKKGVRTEKSNLQRIRLVAPHPTSIGKEVNSASRGTFSGGRRERKGNKTGSRQHPPGKVEGREHYLIKGEKNPAQIKEE